MEKRTMNKTLKLALSAVLGVALVAPAFAQNFPDVPENHWAYQALANLKDKVVFGYPDGFYRGTRMMTRYEFAVAVDKLYQLTMAQFDGVNSKIDALQRKVDGMGTGGGADAGLTRQLEELRNQVNAMRNLEGAINDLRRLTSEFEKELTDMGVNVEDMKRSIADLDARVKALEEKKAVSVNADVNLLVLAGHSDGTTKVGLLPDGTVVGLGRGSYAGGGVGLTRDLSILHEAFITLGGETEGVSWKGVLKVGNVLDGLGNLSQNNPGSTFSDNGDTDVAFGLFSVTFGGELVGQGFRAEIGRVGHQVSPYLWKRTSYTSEYYKNAWRDSGDYYFDGGILDFNFGQASLKVFGGRNSERNTTNGTDLNPIALGNGLVDRTLGVQLSFPLQEMGAINLAYLWHDSDTLTPIGAQNFNRLNVYGADVNLKFSNISFHGAFGQSTLTENTSNRLDDDNTAYDVALGFNTGGFDIRAGYRRVEANYFAAGDWGRIGTIWSPRNVQGFNVALGFNPSADLNLFARGELLEGVQNGAGFLGKDDEAITFTVGANYRLSNFLDLGVKYEDVKFDYNTGTDPYQRWITLMLGYNVSDNAKLSFSYIYSDVDFKGRTGLGNPAFLPNGINTNQFRGGLLATQLSVRF